VNFEKRRERKGRERYRCDSAKIYYSTKEKNTKIKITFTPLPVPSLLPSVHLAAVSLLLSFISNHSTSLLLSE